MALNKKATLMLVKTSKKIYAWIWRWHFVLPIIRAMDVKFKQRYGESYGPLATETVSGAFHALGALVLALLVPVLREYVISLPVAVWLLWIVFGLYRMLRSKVSAGKRL